MSHTPGPWYVDPALCSYQGCIAISDAGCAIAHVETPALDLQEENAEQMQADAIGNARLIAVAPELLELANHITAMEGDSYLEGHPKWEGIFHEAQSIIKKVEGE